MPFRTSAVVAIALLPWLAAQSLAAPTKLWEATGLDMPESAIVDAANSVIYVSNIGGAPTDKDGNGFISKLSLDGKVIERKWATDMDGPKGLALVGSKLYAADITALVEIDTNDGKILNRYPVTDPKFVNDAVADAQGNVYVSDMGANTIWRLSSGRFEPWLTDTALDSPNGLYFENDKLIVAAWGVMPEDGKPGRPSNLKQVSLSDKKVSNLGAGAPVGNLDGIEAEGPGKYLVTDWVAGGLFRIDETGKAEKIIPFKQGSADIEYLADSKTVIVPLMLENRIEAYKLD